MAETLSEKHRREAFELLGSAHTIIEWFVEAGEQSKEIIPTRSQRKKTKPCEAEQRFWAYADNLKWKARLDIASRWLAEMNRHCDESEADLKKLQRELSHLSAAAPNTVKQAVKPIGSDSTLAKVGK